MVCWQTFCSQSHFQVLSAAVGLIQLNQPKVVLRKRTRGGKGMTDGTSPPTRSRLVLEDTMAAMAHPMGDLWLPAYPSSPGHPPQDQSPH